MQAQDEVDEQNRWQKLGDMPPEAQCPICHKDFASPEDVVEHLDGEQSPCANSFIASPLPIPPGLRRPQIGRGGLPTRGQYHPTSGYTFGKAKNVLQQLEDDKYNEYRKENTYWPFKDEAEWGLAKFLARALNDTEIDQFLKLDWFKTRERPTFKSKDQLLTWLDILPKGPQWRSTTFQIDGYPTKHPITLIWRDALEVVRDLFGNPVFAQGMSYDPHIVFDGLEREFGEWMTGDRAWAIQNLLPEGATIVPIIAASDKTPVTRHTGDLEMHPLFITIGNIQSDARMRATSHAWRCVAYLPVPEFDVHPDYATVLGARLIHKCLDMIFANCKIATRVGQFMPDPCGDLRYSFPPLVSYVSDLPEQQMLSNKIDPWDLDKFQKESKKVNLLGVHQPFWRNWRFACPSVFLTPEILHTCLKFFFDHMLIWCKELLGHDELNLRYQSQHKRVGTRHFSKGVSHVKQMTGREHRDIQRTIVATIAGPAPPQFVRVIRALVDFIYLAQNHVHTPSTIQKMVDALAEFHEHKDIILETEARRGKKGAKVDFFIPKLELLQNFARAIQQSGSLMSYSADRTNRQRQNFTDQIVRRLDREEAARLFDLFALLQSRGISLVNAVTREDDYLVEIAPALAWIARVLPEATRRIDSPRPVTNHFLKGILSDDARTAFHLTVAADRKKMTVSEIEEKYQIEDFRTALGDYIDDHANANPREFNHWNPNHGYLRVWYKFRIQLRSVLKPRSIMPSQLVQAYPPSGAFPRGNCDAVLVQGLQSNGQHGCYVAQVRAVFQPNVHAKNPALPSYLAIPLVYVQFFEFATSPQEQPHIGMWTLRRMYRERPGRAPLRFGEVLPLTDITHAVEIVPVYGLQAPRDASAVLSQEAYEYYYLNNYSDKEIYHAMHVDIM
ncbi:hypothetical protein BV22DRAFT_1107182 [Leucogyrophana mollusca]|uniref:Uncharacterized protein n=1 Tax=Leucogyrophana mollusca TaxID=85980 RepID=A0ACB8B6N3_9AGAM|nr:hypothetical protein BV22DRAFT_1107182 [Leucogyrophana mollusca]